MVRENGAWKVQSFNFPHAEKMMATMAPTDNEGRELVRSTLIDLLRAAHTKTLGGFLVNCAQPMRDEYSTDRLRNEIRDFSEAAPSLSMVREKDIAFETPPGVDADHNWTLKGVYPSNPKIRFTLKYKFEQLQWKLLSLRLSLEPF